MSDTKLSFENWYKLTYDKGGFIYPSQSMDKISFNTMVERVEMYNSYLANGESKEHIPALHLRGVSRCFSSESELRLHIETSIPIAIKPTRKSKTTFVYPFTSYKAKEAVVECIVESLLNNG